jgi:hypothetical protein
LLTDLFLDLVNFRFQFRLVENDISQLSKQSNNLKLTWIAFSLFNTLDNMATPCSVKADGKYFECSPLFKVTICDLKAPDSPIAS